MLPVLCIGKKSSKDHIRAIKLGDEFYIMADYNSDIKWYEDSKSGDIIVYNPNNENQKISIDKSRTKNTYGECWPDHSQAIDVSSDDTFFYNLIRIFGKDSRFVKKILDENREREYEMIKYVVLAFLIAILMFVSGYYIGSRNSD